MVISTISKLYIFFCRSQFRSAIKDLMFEGHKVNLSSLESYELTWYQLGVLMIYLIVESITCGKWI